VNTIVLVGPEGQVVCERCEIADGFFSRARGLLRRRQLPSGQGVLIRPTWSVDTAFMRSAIDVVFLDADLTVLKVARHLQPWRATVCLRAHSALELPAGECERLRIDLGDRLGWGSLEPGQ
jgi:uncharacterized protein